MPKFPVDAPKRKVIKALEALGFLVRHQIEFPKTHTPDLVVMP